MNAERRREANQRFADFINKLPLEELESFARFLESPSGDEGGTGRGVTSKDGFGRWASLQIRNADLKLRILELKALNYFLKLRIRILGGKCAGLPARVPNLKPLSDEVKHGNPDGADATGHKSD